MTDRYANIRKALEMGPTKGPWRVNGTQSVRGARGEYIAKTNWNNGPANAALIAACDPDTIRELLAERDQLAAALEAAREDALQPIETCPNADRVVMFCDERQNIWTDCAWNRSSAATGFYATHWRPLPAPPAIDQARGKGVG